MAEVTSLRNNALPYPVYNAAYGLVFPIVDADGDLVTGAAGLDSEISKNGDTFADCTNEATEIGSSGMYYLLLTATELTTDVATIIVKTSTSGAKTTPMVLYPKKLPIVTSGVSQAGGALTITLASTASAVDSYTGCLIVSTNDGTAEARIITAYDGSTKIAVIVPGWNTQPDSDDTYIIYLPDGVMVPSVNVTHAAATAWNSGAIGAATLASDTITAAKIAADAITAAKIATGAIDADALAADAGTEIGTAVWATATRVLTAATNISGPIADQVWEEAIADHSGTAGSTAEQLAAAGASGDPWATALPGAYTSGQAGKIVGDNLNATVGSRATQTSVDDLPTNAELATALASADDAVLAAIAALNNLSQANIRTAVGLASANLDTQLDALPTNAELATALGTADDAVLAAIAALNNLSQANIRTAVGLASANLDTQLDALPTNAELTTALAAADDAVLAAIAALNNLSAAQVTAAVPTATQNADALLKRDLSAVTGEAARSALNALRFLRNKWSIAGAVLTVTKEDDTTTAWTGAVTQTAGDPVSEIDPA